VSRLRPSAPLRSRVLSPPVRGLPPSAPVAADSGPASPAPPARYPPSAGVGEAASAYGRVESRWWIQTTIGAATIVGVVVAAWAMIAIPARATYGTLTTADEPQYLLSALSLFEDGDLHIDDELADARFVPFHELDLPVQTEVLDNGHQVSPHDPLLPAILAVPMGLGGWAAAKATLAALGGVLAAVLVWTAHGRFAVPLGVAAATVLAFGVTAPLSAYATQVYPELPAALAVTAAIALLTGGRSRAALVGFGLAVTALPWLGVKYAPVAAALMAVAVATLVGERRIRAAASMVVLLGLAGIAYLAAHRLLYGGWTVYATGDHFTGGELTVMGRDPDYVGRSHRLGGLLLDRGFGLAAWMPAYLLAVPALAALARRRPPGWWTLVAPLAAGWATAAWVALTMHGWWWPGRQVVVVAPCLVLAIAWWAGRTRAARGFVVVAGVFGALAWGWLVAEVLDRRRTLIFDFESTANPLYRAWRLLLPDYRHLDAGDWLLQAAWFAALAAAGLVALRVVRSRSFAAGRSGVDA
jgi:hypothetical protein